MNRPPLPGPRAMLSGWLVAAAGYLFVPADGARLTYFGIVALQAAACLGIRWRRRVEFGGGGVWLWLATAMALAASGGLIHGVVPGHDTWPAWSVSGEYVVAASLVAYGVFAALLAAPLLVVAELHVPVGAALGGFGAISMAYLWMVTDRTSTEFFILALIVALGGMVVCVSVMIVAPYLRTFGRIAEIPIAFASVAFGLGQTVALVMLSLGSSTNVRAASIIIGNGTILGAMVHPSASQVGTRLANLTDRNHGRAIPAAFGAVIVAAGAIAAIHRFSGGLGTVAGLSVGVAVQFVVLTWMVARWLDSGNERGWLRRFRLRRDIRRAVERGEIVAQYHPIVSVGDGRCVGFSSVAHWLHPRWGLIEAAEFLATVQATHRGDEVGRHVIVCAARARSALAWGTMAELPFISVDMAASGLERSGWASDLLSALGAEGLSGEGLIIELSENWQISCWPVLEENIAAVRRSGFRISVVDFGAGEVNLDLMSRLTIDVIALDRELTEQAMTSRRGAAIVHATTRSAHFAGTMIVASGVNDPAWVSELANLGVDFVRI